MLANAAGREISQEEGALSLKPSSTIVRVVEICAHVSVDASLVPLTRAVLLMLGAVLNS